MSINYTFTATENGFVMGIDGDENDFELEYNWLSNYSPREDDVFAYKPARRMGDITLEDLAVQYLKDGTLLKSEWSDICSCTYEKRGWNNVITYVFKFGTHLWTIQSSISDHKGNHWKISFIPTEQTKRNFMNMILEGCCNLWWNDDNIEEEDYRRYEH